MAAWRKQPPSTPGTEDLLGHHLCHGSLRWQSSYGPNECKGKTSQLRFLLRRTPFFLFIPTSACGLPGASRPVEEVKLATRKMVFTGE